MRSRQLPEMQKSPVASLFAGDGNSDLSNSHTIDESTDPSNFPPCERDKNKDFLRTSYALHTVLRTLHSISSSLHRSTPDEKTES